MFYIYVIESIKDGDLYIGRTNNLERRLLEHNKGLNFSTKCDKPWKIIYTEGCLDQDDAKRREGYLKKTQGQRLLKRRLKEYFYKNKRKI